MKKTGGLSFRPRMNVGCLFDIMTGRWVTGSRGETILNGGLAPFTGVGGPPNHFKSALSHYLNLTVLDRYRKPGGLPEDVDAYEGATSMVYDTETTFDVSRLGDLKSHTLWLKDQSIQELVDVGLINVYNKIDYYGENWWTDIKESMAAKEVDKKRYVSLPFLDKDGKAYKVPRPDVVTLDSLTEFSIENLEKLMDANEIGHKNLNMEAMVEMKAKSHMVRQLPIKTAASGVFMIATAHVGEEHQMDPYAITPKKLLFLKGNAKFKRVPNQFNFLPNDVYYIFTMKVLKNASSKGPEFPTKRGGDFEHSPELQQVEVYNTRGKSGPTGFSFSLIMSQSEGLLPSISEFVFLRKNKKYGLGGNDQNYYLELMPDEKLSRTTVRDKIDESHRLQRAMHITSEMCYMDQVGIGFDRELLCTPKELYEDIKKLGYDWAVLLDTRDYWLPTEWDVDGVRPYLSTMDLLRMRKGLYTPYWLPKKK
jgi:hypothetical protein